MTGQYAELARESTIAAAVLGTGADDFMLAWLSDDGVCGADATAAGLKGYRLLGFVGLIAGEVVCKTEPPDLILGCKAAEYFTQRLEAMPASLLDLERLAALPDTREDTRS